MYSPETCERSVESAREAAGWRWTDSVSLHAAGPTSDFLELDAQEWQDDEYDQQGNLVDPIKVKEGKREEIAGIIEPSGVVVDGASQRESRIRITNKRSGDFYVLVGRRVS